MQTASSRIRARVVVSIFNDDNRYATSGFFFFFTGIQIPFPGGNGKYRTFPETGHPTKAKEHSLPNESSK